MAAADGAAGATAKTLKLENVRNLLHSNSPADGLIYRPRRGTL